ncbi:MAG: glycosyltransferase family 4 protein [Acidobacteriota bacterium]|nr:glycosyltransferase family 4 protein [Acidobacteriota bacterium]
MGDPFILQVSREIGLRGGSECVAFELHRAWLAKGIDARVVTSHATEAEAREGISFTLARLTKWVEQSNLHYLPTLLLVPLFTLAASWKAWRIRGPKIVLSHGDSLLGDVCVAHAVNSAALAEKRRTGYYGWLLNPTNLWVAARDKWMLRGGRYRRIVAISERVRRQLKEYHQIPDERIVTIPNGINLSRFNPQNARARAEVRQALGIAEEVPLVLFLGNQYRLKGLEFAIRALAEMKTKASLLVVGADVVSPFKRLAAHLGLTERVIFAGARTDLPLIYPAADAFVLPTLYETFALVCLEAMASGLPVLASPVGGVEDYLRDDENGFHIQRDAAEIASKLDRVLNDPKLHARIREQGLATAENYAWDKIAGQYLKLFEELISERARSSQSLAVSEHGVSV